MNKPEPNFEEMEKALLRLMPVAMEEEAQERMEAMLDGLAGDSKVVRSDFRKPSRWLAGTGIAAALGLGVYLSIPRQNSPVESVKSVPVAAQSDLPPELVFLSETDRVEGMSDEGLYIDTGGSAVRKVRIRVVVESQVRDEETGIVVMLTEPREEMYMVPVSTF